MLNTATLFEANPWWTNPAAIDQDRSVQEWMKAVCKWQPRLVETIQWDVDVIYVLRGPRQVGKTTLCKLKIRELLSTGTAPRAIFYWACDLIETPEKLVEVVDTYLAFAKDTKERRYLFLDEISSVEDWQKGIKYLYDQGRLRGSTAILTGSHSIDLRRATETLAGRRGDVHKLADPLPDKVLVPMKFSEYAESRSAEVGQLIRQAGFLSRANRHALLAAMAKGELPKALEEAHLYLKTLSALYNEYLITGGIPRAINAFVVHTMITRDIYEAYVELLLRDIRKWGGNESLMRQIVTRLIATQGSPVSLRNLQEDTEISSHHTASAYLDFVKDSFVVTAIYKLDRNRDSPTYRGPKKIHFADPFMYHALQSWALGGEPFRETLAYLQEDKNVGQLTECVVADHLVRLLFSYSPSTQFDYTRLLFYWQSSKKREVDFILKRDAGYFPLEVKYQSKVAREDGFGIIDFQKGGKAQHGLLLTKESLELKNSYLQVPVPLFLLLV
jgi:hypothetical protein